MPWDGVERRSINRTANKLANSFTPQTPLEGFIWAKMDSLEKRFDALPCPETFKRLSKVENDLSNIKGKATVLGIVFGAVTGFITTIFTKYILGK